MWLKEFLREDTIKGTTMNFVSTPMVGPLPFPVFLYALSIIITVAIIVSKKSFSKSAMLRAFIYSLVAAGFIFALRMDYNWFRIMKKDMALFSGKSVTERMALLEVADFYDFMTFVKNTIPEGGRARFFPEFGRDYYNPDNYYRLSYYQLKGRYYLLPTNSSVDGEFIWIFQNHMAYFIPSTDTLIVGNSVIAPVKLLASYGTGGYLFRVVREGK